MPIAVTVPVDVKAFKVAFHRNVIVFEQKLPEMLEKHPGQYVGIHNGSIFGYRGSWKELVQLAAERFPDDFDLVLVEQVVPKDETTSVAIDTLET